MTEIHPAVPTDWSALARRRIAFLHAHPGHELRLHAGLETLRPVVFLLTDGSGSGGAGRLAHSRALLAATGATPGAVFGRWTDRELYAGLMDGSHATWIALARELAELMAGARIDHLVADGFEGFNPAHDLCRLIAETATILAFGAERAAGRCLAFPLEAAPADGAGDGPAHRLVLSPEQFARKRAAAARYAPLGADIQEAVSRLGWDAFAEEWLHPRAATPLPADDWRPGYERYGEQRRAAGRYADVLRYREHFLPAARALRGAAGRST